jgi:hypothetical protein
MHDILTSEDFLESIKPKKKKGNLNITSSTILLSTSAKRMIKEAE